MEQTWWFDKTWHIKQAHKLYVKFPMEVEWVC